MVTEAILAYQAVEDGLEQWDKGERERAAHVFLRSLAGPQDPRRIHERWIPHLRAVACANRRHHFKKACEDIAGLELLGV